MTDEYFLIGANVSSSPSPQIFNFAFSHCGIDASYKAINVEKGRLKEAFAGLKSRSAKGLNVTIPFKTEIVKLLDTLDPTSSAIKAVNVVSTSACGYKGYNTDVVGILKALRKHGIDSVNRALLVGAGGAARAFCAAVNRLGCRNVRVVVRNTSRAESFLEAVRQAFPLMKVRLGEESEHLVAEYDLIFNATPVGQGSVLPPHSLSALLDTKPTVFDAVYYPLETELIVNASKRGCRTIRGSEMLLYQAAAAFRIWTKREAPEDEMFTTLLRALGAG